MSRSLERANALSHGVGFVLAVVGAPVVILSAIRKGGVAEVVGAGVFALTATLLYLASTVYHSTQPGRFRDLLRRLDHAAIYLLIAGTYTPFTLGVLSGVWGWTLLGIVWSAAVVGIGLKLVVGVRRPRLSAFLYLAMGWLAIVAAGPLLEALPLSGVLWIGAGGIAYTVGVPFYLSTRLRHGHLVWHLFVLAGTACHYVAVLRYAI